LLVVVYKQTSLGTEFAQHEVQATLILFYILHKTNVLANVSFFEYLGLQPHQISGTYLNIGEAVPFQCLYSCDGHDHIL
jgi:hypothetical protein